MKILYGVQGTGNGHITRARIMARHLYERNMDVQFVFSGRSQAHYYDMEIFRDYRTYPGLSFSVRNGTVQYLDSARRLQPRQFFKDKRSLRANNFDLIITDFEPLTAWAAKQTGTPSLGIGHQYAFRHDVPRSGDNFIANKVLQHFAPTRYCLGLHWHHFNAPILPPIIECGSHIPDADLQPDAILVYLPFDNQADIIKLLQQWPNYRFSVFSNDHPPGSYRNVSMHPQSRDGFLRELSRSSGVICNAGFELISEALSLGKKLLVSPLRKQMEQQSNAAALKELGFATTTQILSANTIGQWLDSDQMVHIHYPDVAKAVVDWITAGNLDDIAPLVDLLWSNTRAPQYPDLFNKAKGDRPQIKRSKYELNVTLCC